MPPTLPMPISVGLCRYCPEPSNTARKLWAVVASRGWKRLICGECLIRAIREDEEHSA